MRLKRSSTTPNEKTIYVAAIAESHKCLTAYIIVDYDGETSWSDICKPFGSGFHNMQEKALYAEAYALQQAKAVLRKKKINPELYDVYFNFLKEKYKHSVPSPVTLEKTLKLAIQAKSKNI